MNNERLEIIKSMHENDEEIHQFDIDWLIERTAEAERLEIGNIKLVNKIEGLEDSLRIYKEENDRHEQSTHIENFMYEMRVNEEGEIPLLIKANGIEHSFGITERDVRSFTHIFQMRKMK